jgi:hypothetical protein
MSELKSAHLIMKILQQESKAEFVKTPITNSHPKSAYEKSENERIEVRSNCHNKIKKSSKPSTFKEPTVSETMFL